MPGLTSAATFHVSTEHVAEVPSDTVVIVPAFREADGIGPVVKEFLAALNTSVVVVCRPANDDTEFNAESCGAIVIPQRGKGKGNAVSVGLDYVRQNFSTIRYIGFVDADGTYPARPMDSMRSILESTPSVGMVIGQRLNLKNNGVKSAAFAVGNRLLGRLHQIMNNVPVNDPLSGLRMVRASAIQNWEPRSRGFDIEAEMNSYLVNQCGLEIAEVPVRYRPRVGEKKLRLRHGLIILGRIVSLSLRRVRSETASVPTPATRVSPYQH
jgi:glycosyltransferase involved in cell wall biosynthesis